MSEATTEYISQPAPALGFWATVRTGLKIAWLVARSGGDIGYAFKEVTHKANGAVWFKRFNMAIIGHPDLRHILQERTHTKGNIHRAITRDIGPILVSLNPGHPREEIRAALQKYLDASHVANYSGTIQQIISEHAEQSRNQKELRLDEFCNILTLEIMYKSLFAHFEMQSDEREVFADAIATTVLLSFVSAVAGGTITRLARILTRGEQKRAKMDAILKGLWEQYSSLSDEQLEEDAFGQLVLSTRQGKLSIEEARTQAIIIISAGHETTSSALAWLLYYLAKHPDYQTQIRDEVMGLSESDLKNAQVLRSLPILNQAIDEILRLYAPVWMIARELGQDTAINHMTLPQGTNVWMITTAAHRWQENFEQADTFLLSRDKALYREFTVPFGAGYGSCVGAPFARTEMQIVIATLLRRFEISPSARTPHIIRPVYATAIRIPKTAYIALRSIS